MCEKLIGFGLTFDWMKGGACSVVSATPQTTQAQNTWCMGQLEYIDNCIRMGKSPIVKVFLPQMCRKLVSYTDFKAILIYWSYLKPLLLHSFFEIVLLHIFFSDRRFSRRTILYVHRPSHTPRILSLWSLRLFFIVNTVTLTFSRCKDFWCSLLWSVDCGLKMRCRNPT